MSLDEGKCIWSSINDQTNATDEDNGMNNMNTIKGISGWKSKYPPFKWCDDKNTNGITGWYYPAINELKSLYDSWNAIEDALLKYGTNFEMWIYSSSTEKSSNWYRIHALDFRTGGIQDWYKDHNQSTTHFGICPVRSIRKF
jgi:hypothetical protein